MQLEFRIFEDGTGGMLATEEWRAVAGFPRYDVSSLGRFRRRATGQILTGTVAFDGYIHLCLTSNGKPHTKLAHRLVAETFLERPSPQHTDVNHRNKDRTDNRVTNLEWMTRSQNSTHAHRYRGAPPTPRR